jgi:hypothetical protein
MKEFITEKVANTIKSLSKKTLLITILLSLISSASTYWLVDSMNGFKSEIKKQNDALVQLASRVAVISDNYIKQREHWQQKDSVQKKQLAKTDTALSKAKQKQTLLQAKLEENLACNEDDCDSSCCDSVQEDVKEYIDATVERDSLCDEEISELKEIVQTKDSALNDCNESFLLLKQTTDSSIVMQTHLVEQLKLADKELRKKNLKSKILSSAVLVLSGATAILILKK